MSIASVSPLPGPRTGGAARGTCLGVKRIAERDASPDPELLPPRDPSYPDLAQSDLDLFVEFLTSQGRSARTIQGYAQNLRQFARWFEPLVGAPFTVQVLTQTDAQLYREYLLARKAAPATVNRALAALRAFAVWGIHVGKLATSPIDDVPGVEEQRHAPKWLEKPDQDRFVREVEQAVNLAQTEPATRQAQRDVAIVIVLLNTGLRISELCALELDDVDLRKRKGTVVVRRGKGTKQRTIPLNLRTRHALSEWLDARPQCATRAVFIGQRQEPLKPRAVQRLLAEYGRRAGVEVTPHTLRHCFAKRMVERGVSLEMVAELMGHASLDTTRIYTTPGEKDLKQAVELIG